MIRAGHVVTLPTSSERIRLVDAMQTLTYGPESSVIDQEKDAVPTAVEVGLQGNTGFHIQVRTSMSR